MTNNHQRIPKVVISVTMDPALDKAIRAYCGERDIPLTVWARQALQRELKRCQAIEAADISQ